MPSSGGQDARFDLWAGMFLAPLIAVVNFQANWLMVSFACQTGQRWALHVSPVTALIIALWGLSMALRNWRAAGARWPDEHGDHASRLRWMAMFGVLFSGTGCALIIAQWTPVFLMSPCVG